MGSHLEAVKQMMVAGLSEETLPPQARFVLIIHTEGSGRSAVEVYFSNVITPF